MSKKSLHIDISERKLLLRSFDVIVMIISISLASFYSDFNYLDVSNGLVYVWFLVLFVYFLLFGNIFRLYNLKVSSSRFLVVRSIFITSLITTLAYVFSPYITPSLPYNRLQIIYFFLLITLPVILWRFIYIWLLFSPKFFKTIVVIGHSSRAEELIKLINFKKFHNIDSYISNKEVSEYKNFYNVNETDISNLVKDKNISEIVLSTAGFDSETIKKINKQLIQLFEEGISIKSFETYYEEITHRIPKEYLDHNFYKQFNFSEREDSRFYLFALRIGDIFISILGLLLFLVSLPLILFGNFLGNRGSLFYTQNRVGHKGKQFKIFKLRSMIHDAEKNGAVWAQKNDKRITFFGRFLRTTRLDEVPQFYNILKGEMSLIGPRPERPEFVKNLQNQIPFYTIRHVIKPGLTGWAQVNYPYASTLEEQETKLRYDLFYIKERSPFLDFKILVKTIFTVLLMKGQ